MKHWLIGLSLLFISAPCHAHWASPGYLQLEQTEETTYTVLWKVPTQAGRPLKLTPILPQNCVEATPTSAYQAGTAFIQRWVTRCADGLIDQTISIEGLSNSLTDVLVRINRVNGTTQTERLTANRPSFSVLESPGWIDISQTYLVLGIEHILSGVDHLLFIFALLIIVSGWRRLVATVTAFTLAHSLTLGAATLGFVFVPRPPVEAVIALSILFLAVEITRHQISFRPGKIILNAASTDTYSFHRQQSGVQKVGTRRRENQSLTYEWPWLVAFTFGLLHGFGFAGALTEVGLPENAIPLALLFFNLGVEVGQLLFVAGFLLLSWVFARLIPKRLRWMEVCAAYIIGAFAAYWTIERVVSFWA